MAFVSTGSSGMARGNLLSSSLGCAIAQRLCQGQQSCQSRVAANGCQVSPREQRNPLICLNLAIYDYSSENCSGKG